MLAVPLNSTVTAPLGFTMSYPDHLQCSIRPRSSLSLRGINVALGTIDPDYRGEVKAIIANTSPEPFNIAIGQRIGQLIFAPIAHPKINEVDSLQETRRGQQGFGSTGQRKLRQSKRARSPIIPFLPTLPSISEYPQQVIPSKSYATATAHKSTVNNTSFPEIEKLVNTFTETDVEDVPIMQLPKQVHDDAIHLFPLNMYKSGNLNITGNTDLDSTASPATKQNQPPPTPTTAPSPSDDPSPSEEIPNSIPPPAPPPQDEEQIEQDFSVQFTPLSASTSPTIFIDEYNIYDYLDDDDVSVSSTDSLDDVVLVANDLPPLTSILDQSLTRPTPRIPPTDRVSSTEPANKIVTTEYMQKCFGFRNITPILKTLKDQSLDTITVRDTGNHPILSRGETATLAKAKSNSNPVKKPAEYGQIWHYDIVYGNGRAIEESNMPSFSSIEKAAKRKSLVSKISKNQPSAAQ